MDAVTFESLFWKVILYYEGILRKIDALWTVMSLLTTAIRWVIIHTSQRLKEIWSIICLPLEKKIIPVVSFKYYITICYIIFWEYLSKTTQWIESVWVFDCLLVNSLSWLTWYLRSCFTNNNCWWNNFNKENLI